MAVGAWHAGSALVVQKSVGEVDAIVSLASHEWERLPATARLASEHPRAAVLLTLPATVNGFNCHDCSNRLARLQRLGVAAARVHVLPLSAAGTYGEALAVQVYARDSKLRRLLVVTSPYHTRRSLATFAAVLGPLGVEVGVEPSRATSPARPDRWWSAPYDRAYVAYEWAASIFYWWQYGVQVYSVADYDSGRMVVSFFRAPGAAARYMSGDSTI
jgi:uncharacterized SAM-binding protein YcdF (DUF218 family)